MIAPPNGEPRAAHRGPDYAALANKSGYSANLQLSPSILPAKTLNFVKPARSVWPPAHADEFPRGPRS
jgi:hypothetical protein